jgi:tetratricopeptide (TPR) repeat protein
VAKKKSRSQRARARERQATGPIERGQRAFHQGDYDGALSAWQEALAEGESDVVRSAVAEVHFRRGLAGFYRDENRAAGLADLNRAAGMRPDELRYTYHLGLAYHRLGDLDSALLAYDLVLAADPPFDRAAWPAVVALLEQGRDPASSVAWQRLSPAQRDEFSHLLRLMAGQAPAPGTPEGQPARVWHALAAVQAGQASGREALWETAQDDGEPRPVRALAAYALGVQAQRAGRQEEAVGHWEAAQRLGLESPVLAANLQKVYYSAAAEAMEEGRWADAASLATEALDLVPGDQALAELAAAAHFYAGHAEAVAGHWPRALTHLEAARDLGETSRDLVQDLALAQERAGNYEEAGELWREVVRRRPRKADAPDALTAQQVAMLWGHISECYRKAGDMEEALKTLRNAVKNDPDNIDLRLELVDGLMADDRWQAADNEVQRVLDKAPEHVGALVRAARIAETSHWPGAAQPLWEKVLSLAPDHPEARERLADLLVERGNGALRMAHFLRVPTDYDEVLACYDQALAYTPGDAMIYLARARVLLLQEDFEGTRGEMARAFDVDPHELAVYASAVDLCHRSDWHEGAEWAIAYAREQAGAELQPGFYLDLAEARFKAYDNEVGEAYVQRAEELAAGNAGQLVLIAEFYITRGKARQSSKYLDEALRIDPEHGAAHMHMGYIYAADFDMREARRHWRLARRIARKTNDRELLAEVKEMQDFWEEMVERMEYGLPPRFLDFGAVESFFDDDDDDDEW